MTAPSGCQFCQFHIQLGDVRIAAHAIIDTVLISEFGPACGREEGRPVRAVVGQDGGVTILGRYRPASRADADRSWVALLRLRTGLLSRSDHRDDGVDPSV